MNFDWIIGDTAMIKAIRIFLALGFLALPLAAAHAALQQIVEVDVKGMTCPFCVHGVEKNLSKLPGIEKVEVSLQLNKARVIMRPGQVADVERIKKIIVESGFTPEAVTVNIQDR